MFGFGAPSEADLKKKAHEIHALMNPQKLSSELSAPQRERIGILCIQYESIIGKYRSGEQKSSNRKKAMKDLKGIEKEARKLLRK